MKTYKCHLAAALVRATGCTVAHAAREFDCSEGSVHRVLKRPEPVAPAVAPPVVRVAVVDNERHESLSKPALDRAVAFMKARDCTVRRAAEVYGVDRWDLLDRWNAVMGTNRQLVGEARPVTDGRRSTP